MRCSILILLFTVHWASCAPFEGYGKQDECSDLNADATRCAAYWGDSGPPLLVVSLDGFRSEYLNRTLNSTGIPESASPILHLLGRCGVQTPFMVPVYPSLTFPNHYSIVTGLYPESHGIVANDFQDPQLGLNFSLSSPTLKDPRWWIGEAMWYTAKKQGKKSATYFWPGSDINDPVREPTYWVPYNKSIPFTDRVNQVLEWLTLPIEQRPKFLTLYLEQPDKVGHGEGPSSPLVVDEIVNVDQQLEALVNGLRSQNVLGCVDLIVLSDHGMASTPAGQNLLIMQNFVPDLWDTSVYYDGVLNTIRPNNDTPEERERIGRAIECQDQHLRVYNKWQFPARHHYEKGNRIPSILLDLPVTWRAFFRSEYYTLAGNHGWDNLNPEMQAIFIAQGPSFKQRYEARSFHNIELYNLMCALVGVDPSPNNGTWGALHHILANPPSDMVPEIPSAPAVLPYPADEPTYNLHLQRYKCSLLQGDNTLQLDSSLNLTQTAANDAEIRHAPWGVPRADSDVYPDLQLLVSSDYLTGYRTSEGIASWVSYSLRQTQASPVTPQYRLDVRLLPQQSAICDRLDGVLTENTQLWTLYPPGFASKENDTLVDTNLVALPTKFVSRMSAFHDLISQAATAKGEVHVISGPVRNELNPSLFYVVIGCDSSNSTVAECPTAAMNIQSFLLPIASQFNQDCTEDRDFFVTHLASLRDVENAAKLQLLPELPYRDKAELLSRTLFDGNLIVDPVLPRDQ